MKRSLNVVHVIHSLGPGGAEHTLVDLAAEAPKQDINMSVVSLMGLGSASYPKQLRDLGIAVRSLDLSSRWDPRGLSRGLRVIRDLQPQLVHTHLKHADLVGAWAAHRLEIPMVSTLHLIEDAPTGLGRAKRWLAAQARLRRAARTIAVSQALRSWYLATFDPKPARVVAIPNGVAAPPPTTTPQIARIRREMGVRPGAVVATMVGIMRPGKGHAELLQAAGELAQSNDLQFVILGDGPMRQDLEMQAYDLGLLPDRVVFAGFRDDVAEVLAATDLVVHPSLFDALPTALLHALAVGRPIVASDTGGIPEIVTPETGTLVPPGDVKALAAAVADMVGRLPSPATEAACRARYETEFSAEVWASRLRRLYDATIAESQTESA